MQYKNHIIIFATFIVLLLSSSLYFNSTIKDTLNNYNSKQQQLSNFDNLNKKYSQNSLSKQKQKLFEILDLFDIKYTQVKGSKNTQKISMTLKQRELNKIINYITNSNIIVSEMKIKKLDQYQVNMDISLE